MKERIQKVLSSMGVASRREAEILVARGDVEVNGVPAVPGQPVDPHVDQIVVRGQRVVTKVGAVYIALNKPVGYVTSSKSTHGEQTVLDLVPVSKRVYPVGRLDKETSGLLLLTDDGDWANLVAHPRYRVDKEYIARVRGRPSPRALEELRAGVRLPDGSVTAPAGVRLSATHGGDVRISITVTQGKKRQIRLMCAAVGHPIIDLERTRIAGIQLGALPRGTWRHLSAEEVEGIRVYVRERTVGNPGRTASSDRDRRSRRIGEIDTWTRNRS